MEELANKVFRRIFAKLKPPPDLPMSEWADRYRRLPQGTTAEPGRWSTDRVPHKREIMDSVSDVRIRKVVVMSSSQVTKTELEINTTGYYMHYEPVPILIMQPTITMAEPFSKGRLTKSINETPVLRGMIKEGHGGSSTILEKVYPGGSIAIVGANSPSSPASRPVQVLLADEVDRYPATAGTEDDPLFLASERLTTFWNSKEVYVSMPGNKGASQIGLEY